MGLRDEHAGIAPAMTAAGDAPVALMTALLSLVTFMPGGLFYLFSVSSHATGLMLVCAIVLGLWLCGILMMSRGTDFRDWLVVTMLIVCVSSAHLVVAAFLVDVTFVRGLQSFVPLGAALLAALILSGFLERQEDALPRAARFIMVLFIAFGMLGALRLQPGGSSIALSAEKSVFPFTEPSQFTIAISPFLIHAVVTSRRWITRYIWLAVGLGLALVLQNLSMVVLTAVAAALCLPMSQAVVAVLALLPAMGLLDLDYYTQRLDLSLQSQSYSSLIYRQGWELAADALARSSGWGIGFQQLGYVPFSSPSADLLRVAIGVDSNVVDGGFTAAKLLAEFGIFGIVVLIGYLVIAIRCGLALRTQIDASAPRLSPVEALACSSVCGLVIDLFIRGEGYFSGSILLFEAALFFFWRQRRAGAVRSQSGHRRLDDQARFPVASASR